MTNPHQEFLTSRSRILNEHRCKRARYWMDDAFGQPNVPGSGGFEPVKVAIPLATGGAIHKGLAELMRRVRGRLERTDLPHPWDLFINSAVGTAQEYFKDQCRGRSLDIDQLEQESFVFNEQLALTEALTRLAGTRVIPKLLELYEVLEVERMDTAELTRQGSTVAGEGYCERCGLHRTAHDEQGTHEFRDADPDWVVTFRSIPDALVRSRADNDLYVISWKTTSEYSSPRDQDARTDMQGLSEPWALEKRLQDWHNWLKIPAHDPVHRVPQKFDAVPNWFRDHLSNGGSASVRGVQMIYLVKGQRRKNPDGSYSTKSPLITGLRKTDPTGLLPPEFATERFYTCAEPHPFKYAKGGTCPGNANHKRGDDWESVNMWETPGGIKTWMELLERGGAGLAGNAALESAWVMPVPHFRQTASVKSWERQVRASESRHARDLMFIREYETGVREYPEDDQVWARWNARLDELFPQSTERCGDWFHRRCPAWELCHGPAHVAQHPVGSGMYQVKTQYQPEVESVS